MTTKDILLACTIALCGCGNPLQPGTITIDTVELGDLETDGVLGTRFEFELHLYGIGMDGERFISCAGDNTGLAPVDSPNTTYQKLDAYFRGIDSSGFERESLNINDITVDQLRIVATENDDTQECPFEQSTDSIVGGTQSGDDLIGRSATFSKAELESGVELSFDNVPTLRLSVFSGAPIMNDM